MLWWEILAIIAIILFVITMFFLHFYSGKKSENKKCNGHCEFCSGCEACKNALKELRKNR